ncbi:S-layer homology domain-containing protein [Paenibacillus kandeliae]|uniref:S-layer homology domain-containing protein n=1 Tax=Paenibacillus kandeliae TaxID=3231269 RepID=UPI00345B4806
MNTNPNRKSNPTNKSKTIAGAILTASLLSVSIGSTSFAAAFTDLKDTPDHQKITTLHSQKIIHGVSDTSFAPTASLTQAQALQMIVKAFQLDTINRSHNDGLQSFAQLFPKVKEDAWYSHSFGYAQQAGLDIPQSVDPNAKITREQYIDYVMTSMQVVGKMPATDVVAQTIKDKDKLNANDLDSVQLALVFQIITLDSNGNFHPKQHINRADAAVSLYNALAVLKKNNSSGETTIDVLPGEKTTTSDSNSPTTSDTGITSPGIAASSYAPADNGNTLFMYDIEQAMKEHASDKDAKYFVAIDLFQNGSPIESDSTEAQAELQRLKSLGYDVANATAWTYRGQLEQVDYSYLSGYFTADQLKHFKTSPSYGYAIYFASNGDGSSIPAKDGAISGFDNTSGIAF